MEICALLGKLEAFLDLCNQIRKHLVQTLLLVCRQSAEAVHLLDAVGTQRDGGGEKLRCGEAVLNKRAFNDSFGARVSIQQT